MSHHHAAHDHASHEHEGHAHGPDPAGRPADASARRALVTALVLTGGFALVEAGGGLVAGSLALLSDAGHMLADAGALALALFAHAYARRKPSARASYGHGRAEVLAAFVNALAMLVIVVAIVVEAIRRLLAPVPVDGGTVLGIALAGLAVNLYVAWRLSASGGSVNTRAALLHVMGDILGSLAAIVAGAVILATGWTPIDPILSIVVALLILRSTAHLLRETTTVLMERVPGGLDFADIGTALASIDGVRDVHDLHVWTMGAGDVALSAHMSLAEGTAWPHVLGAAQRVLRERFGIRHATLQPTWPVPAPAGARRVIPLAPAGDR